MAARLTRSYSTRLLSVGGSKICSVSWSPTHAYWIKNCNNCVHKKRLTKQIYRKCLRITSSGFRPEWTLVDITSNTFYKCTVTFRTHFIMGLSNNPTCRKCGTEEETSVPHFVWVWGLGFTQTCMYAFLLFWPWVYQETKYRGHLELC
jgi:hypothetical protein